MSKRSATNRVSAEGRCSRKRTTLALVAIEREQQSVAAVQPRPVEVIADLLDVGGAEIIRSEVSGQLFVAGDSFSIEAAVGEDLHGLTGTW